LVEKTLIEVEPKRCFGFDRVPLGFLKDNASELSKIVTELMFRNLEEEKTSEQWKDGRILPLFKKGDKEKTENYRPISKLCSMTILRFTKNFGFIGFKKFKKRKTKT
jgi:hypothetical protein